MSPGRPPGPATRDVRRATALDGAHAHAGDEHHIVHGEPAARRRDEAAAQSAFVARVGGVQLAILEREEGGAHRAAPPAGQTRRAGSTWPMRVGGTSWGRPRAERECRRASRGRRRTSPRPRWAQPERSLTQHRVADVRHGDQPGGLRQLTASVRGILERRAQIIPSGEDQPRDVGQRGRGERGRGVARSASAGTVRCRRSAQRPLRRDRTSRPGGPRPWPGRRPGGPGSASSGSTADL